MLSRGRGEKERDGQSGAGGKEGKMREKKYKYTLGQYVTYRKVGICKIVDIIYQNFAGQGGAEYYVLCSVYDNNTKVFVPVDSALENEMKEMLSVDEINNIIDISKNVDIIWKDDCRERAAVFEDIITSGDKAKMIWLIKRVLRNTLWMSQRQGWKLSKRH